MSLIIMEGKYVAIDADYSSCHGYYIIKFSSSLYTHQIDFSIGDQFISSGEMVSEVTYFFPININSRYYFLQKTNTLTQFFI